VKREILIFIHASGRLTQEWGCSSSHESLALKDAKLLLNRPLLSSLWLI
jgi:hypothetical protein